MKYKVNVSEELQTCIEIDGISKENAIAQAIVQYYDCLIQLDESMIKSVTFSVKEEESHDHRENDY